MYIVSAPLLLQPLPNRQWKVARSFVVRSSRFGTIIIPSGFVCDLSSIPRFLWWESTPSDYAEAGVIHDWGYHDNHLPKIMADHLYYEALMMLGSSRWRAALRTMALHFFGGLAYRNDAPTRPQPQ